MASPFSELTLLVPNLWDKPWQEYIDGADGLEREFIVVQAQYARILGRLSQKPVTAEKLGWLSLWSRFFGTLAGARGSAEWSSRFAVSVMEPVAFEVSLHLQAVMLPVLEATDAEPSIWSNVLNRLRGYVAWAIHGDQLLYARLLERAHSVNAVFDPKPERQFIHELGDRRDAWERLTGQTLEIISDHEAFHDRAKATARLTSQANRVAKWLHDSSLHPWAVKLRNLESQNKRDRRGAVTLFQLLDLPSSVQTFLNRRGSGFSYFSYLKGSGFIHGSSLEAALLAAEPIVAPDFAKLGNGFD